MMIMNFLRARCLWNITAVFSLFFATTGLSFGTTTTVTVQILPFPNYGTVNPNYNNQSLTNGKAYSMTAQARSSFTFSGWSFTDGTGSHTNSNAKLTFTNGVAFTAYFVDKQKPSLGIQTPPNSTALTNPAIFVTGTARDNDAVTNVSFALINSQNPSPVWQSASTGNGWNNWWITLTNAPNTNTLLVYAVDRSGNCSATNKLKMTYSAAPASLDGMTMTVTPNPPAPLYNATFATSTFSDETGVGSYTYKKSGPVAGKLSLKYVAPPSAASNNLTVTLQFTDASYGTFTNAKSPNSFSLSTVSNVALAAVTGADVELTDDSGTNQILLNFLTPPLVVDNGSMFNVANPLVISLSAQYPGSISDRVAVIFTHLVNQSGTWVTVAPQTYAGTVIDIGTNSTTNTVTILFDKSSFVSKTDLHGPIAGDPLNILTYYTNNLMTIGAGTFIYTNYSPVGSLLQLSVTGQTNYYILTFTNQSTTNSSDAGTYYEATYGANSGFQGADTGTFAIAAPPIIITQPSMQAVTNAGTASFSVVATGSQPLTYQWQLNGTDLTDGPTGLGSVLSGSSTTNLTVSGATTNDIGNYTVVIANGFGTVTSSVATLSVTLAPVITSQPQSLALTNGATARFSVIAAGVPTLTYQWQFNGTNLVDGPSIWSSATIFGSLTANLAVSPISTNDLGNYQVIVNNSYGSVTSSPAATLSFTTGVPTP